MLSKCFQIDIESFQVLVQFRGSECHSIKGQLISLLLFHSVQCLVEMERGNAQSNVVEEEASVTATQSPKPQQVVILIHALSGRLETGVR